MSIEHMKKKGVTYWLNLIKSAYEGRNVMERNNWTTVPTWYEDHVKRIVKNNSRSGFDDEDINEFFNWIATDDGEEWLAQKSPANAANLAIRYRKRLRPKAEQHILEKAKDRGGLLDYCMAFGIVLDNMEKVTLRAAFGEDADQQKRYIKHIEETKKKTKNFLIQLVRTNQIDPNKTIQEFLDE